MASIRLICPNCGATYEIDARAIPHDGRDVQCSNCAHVWFESPAESAEDETPYAAPSTFDAADPDLDDDLDSTGPDRWADPEDTDDEDFDDGFDDEPVDEPPTDPVAPAPSTAPAPDPHETGDAPAPTYAETAFPPPPEPSESTGALPRRPLDSSIADILREEAAREEAARQAEAAQDATFERQTDLPLDSDPARTPPTGPLPDRLATLRGAAPAVSADSPRDRRDQFPDIDEINSSFRTDDEAGYGGPISADDEDESGRFALGFIVALGLILLLLVIYLLAEPLSGAFPALAEPLGAYVDAIDRLRLTLNDWVQGLADRVRGV